MRSKPDFIEVVLLSMLLLYFQFDCSPSLPTSQVKLRLDAAMSTTGFAKYFLGVPIIEQQKGGQISTLTGHNSAKL